MKKQKHVLAIHDISCIGKCSLTVALPILSCAKITTSLLPTALLSTHTGGFSDFTYLSLKEEMSKILKHFETLNVHFDSIYTGFLGSSEIDLVSTFLKSYKNKDVLILIDPVMADDGELYSSFDENFTLKMEKMCFNADILTPNLTEACILLNEKYKENYDEDFIIYILNLLNTKYSCDIVLTGICLKEKIGAAVFSEKDKTINFILNEKIPRKFHGTGDIFASALLSSILNSKNILEATKIAIDFVSLAIKYTDINSDLKYGINFESALYYLSDTFR